MRRLLAVLALVALVASAVTGFERLDSARRYRQLLDEGERAMQSGRTYAAIEAFSGALALHAGSMVAYYRRGEAYSQQEQFESALRDLRAARSIAPEARQPLEALGRLYERRTEYAEAARWYAQAAQTLRDADPALLYRLALARYRAGDPSGAREPLQLALSTDDSMVRAHFLLGLVQRDSQEPADAIASLQHVIRLAPGFLPAREELADLYGALGQTAEERAQLVALAAADPQVARSIAVALADVRSGDFDAARQLLTLLASSMPTDSRIALALARLHLARAERDGDTQAVRAALSALESALAGTARRSEGLSLYGRALYLSGDAAGAERLLQEAVATTPVDLEAFAFLADAAEYLNHPAVARGALEHLDALEGDTASPDRRLSRTRRIGILALAAGDAVMARRLLTEAVRGGTIDAETFGALARSQWTLGEHASARATLARARDTFPNDPALQALTRRFR